MSEATVSAAVSVVVAARDAEPYVGEAIESILGQSLPPSQVLVVDDGSSDGTAEVAAGFGTAITLIRQPATGVGAALNAGLDLATGELLAFLDADDLWLPDKLERQCEVLESQPRTDIVFGHVEQFISPELSEREKAQLDPPTGSAPGKAKSTMLIRRAAFDRVGPFATSVQLVDFIDWYARAREAGLREFMLNQVVALRRNHATNLGRRRRDLRQEYAQVLSQSLRRRKRRSPSP